MGAPRLFGRNEKLKKGIDLYCKPLVPLLVVMSPVPVLLTPLLLGSLSKAWNSVGAWLWPLSWLCEVLEASVIRAESQSPRFVVCPIVTFGGSLLSGTDAAVFLPTPKNLDSLPIL